MEMREEERVTGRAEGEKRTDMSITIKAIHHWPVKLGLSVGSSHALHMPSCT